MSPASSPFDAVTITLNPAIDRTVTVSDFTPGAVNRVEQSCDTPGGKGVNVASALADAGLRVAVTGFLGRENSSLFETLFAQKQMGDCFVRIAGETRVGIKIIDPARHQTTDLNFPGAIPTPAEIAALLERVGTLNAAWFVLGGSLPPGVDPGFYRDLVLKLKARGCGVVLDTSGEPLRLALEASPTILKPNLQELEMVCGVPLGSEAAVIEAARSLVARGVELVAVSMGKEGSCFVTAERVVVTRAPEVEVGSTVGAGDAMVAGIVTARIRGLALEESARLGTDFALAALMRTALITANLKNARAFSTGMHSSDGKLYSFRVALGESMNHKPAAVIVASGDGLPGAVHQRCEGV